jgi:hypothetical protein
MKKVLIVSPRFPPSAGPDLHRVRMLLPFLESNGWEAVVLCVASEFIGGQKDPDLLRTLPSSVDIVKCRAVPEKWSRLAGFGNLALRAGFFLKSAGDRLLKDQEFDLVFFSTTEFLVLPLGLRWLRKFGVPFVVDLQDPWVNPYYDDNDVEPPGGRGKYAIHQAIARFLEKRVLRSAANIITVSPQYPKALMARYENLQPKNFSVIPFGGSRRDFEIARTVEQDIFDSRDGRRHWVYTGAVTAGMLPAIGAFFKAFRRAAETGILNADYVRLHFIGTNYASGNRNRQLVKELADKSGIGRYVEEYSRRIPYLESLRILLDADALLMFGSDEVGYVGSKFFPYVLAEKPLLTVLHEGSALADVMRESNAGVLVSFSRSSTEQEIADQVLEKWFIGKKFEKPSQTKWQSVQQYTPESLAATITRVFDRAAGHERGSQPVSAVGVGVE